MSDAKEDTTSPGDADAARSCEELLSDIDGLRGEMTICTSGMTSSTGTCAVHVPDVCCPLTVSSGVARLEEFNALVAAFKKQGCMTNCPAVPCADKPTRRCEMGNCAQK